MKLKNRIIIAFIVIIALIIVFYAVENIVLKYGEKSAKVIKVKSDDQTMALLSSGVFKELKEQEARDEQVDFLKDFGPSLTYVIFSSGINDFESVDIKNINGETVSLLKSEINANIVFHVAKNKTVSLYNQSKKKFIIKCISEINAKK